MRCVYQRCEKKIFMPEVGFEPTPTNRIELKSTALDHSAIQAILVTTTEGFEPPRVDTHQISNLTP